MSGVQVLGMGFPKTGGPFQGVLGAYIGVIWGVI